MRPLLFLTLLFFAVVTCVGCKEKTAPDEAKQDQVSDDADQGKTEESAIKKARDNLGAFEALPASFETEKNPLTEAKVALGRQLYYDTRFSKNQDISCNTCHDLANWGIDPRVDSAKSRSQTSLGHKDVAGERNSPTVYNAAGHFRQFWDGRAADVEEQALGPVLNPVEMAMPSEEFVLQTLNSIPGYATAFKAAFPGDEDPINFENFGKAVGAFERKLVTPGRWDKFINGDDSALTEAEASGFNTFVEVGCLTCHNGALLGGTTYQKVGSVQPWPNQKDPGRFLVTKKEEDRMLFKTPSLRNIEMTGPYFHDGSVKTLEEAVKLMAQHQLGKSISDEEISAIVAFLKVLTGDVPKDYIAKPELPESGPDTPKADPT